MNTALIFAGGTGARMGNARLPKQFLELGGKPIIAHTIDHFENHPDIDAIVVVCIAEWIDHLNSIIASEHYKKIRGVTAGGHNGQASIYNGLCMMEELGLTEPGAFVLVHDGVRPLIDAATISDVLESVAGRGCTATIAPVVETILEVEGEKVTHITNRTDCRVARAPQGFQAANLLAAHRQALSDGLTDFIDSISLMAHYGYPLFTIDGPSENIKITTPSDFFAFKGYMDMKEMGQLWTD